MYNLGRGINEYVLEKSKTLGLKQNVKAVRYQGRKSEHGKSYV